MFKKSFLSPLSNKNLDEKLNQLISSERELLTEIIIHIREVDSRKMYLDFGYASLFDYLTLRMGYANASAQRRINAARLSMEVPEVIDHIESGNINLSQISVMTQALRQVPKDSKADSKMKEQILAELCEKTVAQSEVIVSKALNIPIKEFTKTKHQKDESTRLEITFTKEQWEKLNKARDLLSHSLPHGTWDQVFEYMSNQKKQKKDKTIVKKPKSIKRSKLKTTELTLDGACKWAGGSNEIENLRTLCSAHNNKVYQEQAGIRSR